HDDVHQARDERHRHEEDHDDAVGGEDLVVMVRRQDAGGVARGHGQLGAHHDGVGEAAQQHDQGHDDVHDADALVVDAGQPFGPQVLPFAVVGDRPHQGDAQDGAGDQRPQDDGVMVWNSV